MEATNFNQFEMSKTDIEADTSINLQRKNTKRRESLPVKGQHDMKITRSKNYAKTQNSQKRLVEPAAENNIHMFESEKKIKKVRLSNKYVILRKKRFPSSQNNGAVPLMTEDSDNPKNKSNDGVEIIRKLKDMKTEIEKMQ